jgi:hypothetical protein
MYANIKQHGKQLNAIFDTGIENIKLCKSLFRLENRLHSLEEQSCNGTINDEYCEKEEKNILDRVDAILNFRKLGIPVFINRDPRGYTLKIDDKYMKENNVKLYQDWGGYGIIAPDFSMRG